MPHDPNNLSELPDLPTPSQPDGRRRRFLGAGAAVTPAILTLASQPALGATCFTPSRSLSRNTSISQQGKYGECSGAESPGNYKARADEGASANHWPASVKPTDPFHPTFMPGSTAGTRFYKKVGNNWVSRTFHEVLSLKGGDDPGKVAFHLIGAYLNAKGGNGARINFGSLDSGETPESIILGIWADWARHGYYEPFAGTRWGAEEIKTYLISNGIVKAGA